MSRANIFLYYTRNLTDILLAQPKTCKSTIININRVLPVTYNVCKRMRT